MGIQGQLCQQPCAKSSVDHFPAADLLEFVFLASSGLVFFLFFLLSFYLFIYFAGFLEYTRKFLLNSCILDCLSIQSSELSFLYSPRN